MGEGKEIRLHLGAGKRKFPGFIHIDLCDYKHIDYKTSVDDLSMFNDSSVDYIYASHVLEYFDRDEVKKVLKEWRRVMKKGAKIRIAVPDFTKLLVVYRKYRNIEKVLGPIYGKMEIKTKNGKEILYHKTMYDYLSLARILRKARFKKIKKYDWRNTIHKDYDDHSQAYIPHMRKNTGILISLNMEAEK